MLITKWLRSARSRTRPERSDAGFTTAELIVSMSILVVIAAMASTFFAYSMRSTTRTTQESQITAQARVAISAMAKLIAVADSATSNPGAATGRFDAFTSTDMVFYANDNGNRVGSADRTAPDKIEFVIDTSAGTLTQMVWNPLSSTAVDNYSSNYSTTATSTFVLARKLGSASAFTYCSGTLDSSGNCVAATATTSIASVGISLVVTSLAGQNAAGSSQTVTSQVAITGDLS